MARSAWRFALRRNKRIPPRESSIVAEMSAANVRLLLAFAAGRRRLTGKLYVIERSGTRCSGIGAIPWRKRSASGVPRDDLSQPVHPGTRCPMAWKRDLGLQGDA